MYVSPPETKDTSKSPFKVCTDVRMDQEWTPGGWTSVEDMDGR